mgnify:CR=1 FL=1
MHTISLTVNGKAVSGQVEGRTLLDALRAQVAAVSTSGAEAFDQWRAQTWAPITEPLAAGEVRLAHLPGQVVIVTGDVGGVAALAAAVPMTQADIAYGPDTRHRRIGGITEDTPFAIVAGSGSGAGAPGSTA